MDEPEARIGIALVVATLLGLAAIVAAEAFGFAIFEDAPLPIEPQHSNIFAAMAHCLNGGSISTKEIVIDCKRRK